MALKKSRNALVFNQREELSMQVWFKSRKVAKGIGSAMALKKRHDRVGCLVSWKHPEPGHFILNTNGAFKAGSNTASAGGLIRDDNGHWVGGFVTNIGYTNSLMAELWRIREGLVLAKNLGLSQVIVELDAAVVVRFLSECVNDCHSCSVLVHDTVSLIQEGWVKEIRHIFRKGNKCADFLANLAQNCSLGTTILIDPPPDLLPLLENDAIGQVRLRS